MIAAILPVQGSTFATSVDTIYYFILWVSIISFIGVIGAMGYFMWAYRRRSDADVTAYIEGHTPTEVIMSTVLFILVMWMFFWGYAEYDRMRTMPYDAISINILGKQWNWDFTYPNGRTVNSKTESFLVPSGRKIKLVMTSKDVIHGFFVPDFRIKQDVVPGMYTTLWFEPTLPGDHQLLCTQFCGTDHSGMLGTIRVVEPAEYDAWQRSWEMSKVAELSAAAASLGANKKPGAVTAAPAIEGPAARGKKLFADRACTSCHTVDGKPGIGPTLAGVFGHPVELVDGQTVKADENYLRESIVNAATKVVKGFQPIMPPYQGQLTTEEVTDLIEYIKTLTP